MYVNTYSTTVTCILDMSRRDEPFTTPPLAPKSRTRSARLGLPTYARLAAFFAACHARARPESPTECHCPTAITPDPAKRAWRARGVQAYYLSYSLPPTLLSLYLSPLLSCPILFPRSIDSSPPPSTYQSGVVCGSTRHAPQLASWYHAATVNLEELTRGLACSVGPAAARPVILDPRCVDRRGSYRRDTCCCSRSRCSSGFSGRRFHYDAIRKVPSRRFAGKGITSSVRASMSSNAGYTRYGCDDTVASDVASGCRPVCLGTEGWCPIFPFSGSPPPHPRTCTTQSWHLRRWCLGAAQHMEGQR
ncbi:hypothetical protein F4780DRAFT_491353 [Xylariomycetidae sp. FL0641]|nr:hypothetical protein F4780DRAFT_491353 [Xylariomycetidae sp. FL0641]